MSSKSYFSETPQFHILTALIRQNNDVFVYGLPGVGKSSIVNQILAENSIRFIKVNCIGLEDKSALMRTLSWKLKKDLSFAMRECTNIHTFVSEVNHVTDQIESSEPEKLYLVFDNFDKVNDVSSKFLASLMKIKECSGIEFSFIFITSSISETVQEVFLQREFGLIPKINIKRPSLNILKGILIDYVMNNRMLEDIPKDQKSIDTFVTDIIYSFQSTVVDINHYKTILIWTCKILLEYKNDISFAKVTSEGLFKFTKKYLLQNPYERVNPKEIHDAYDNSFLKGPQTDVENLQKLPDLQVSPVQAIVLVSCYFGNRNPEKTDKKIFKDYKRRNKTTKRTAKKDDDIKLKPLKFSRFLALVQSIMSISIEDSRETQMFHHSMEFYAEINSLVEMGYITRIQPHNNILNKIKYVCNLDAERIKSLCTASHIRFQDFLYDSN